MVQQIFFTFKAMWSFDLVLELMDIDTAVGLGVKHTEASVGPLPAYSPWGRTAASLRPVLLGFDM